MFEMPEKLNDFSFTISGKKLGTALKNCDAVVRFSDADKMIEDIHMIVSTGSEVYAIGKTIDTFIYYKLDAEDVSGAGAARVDFALFSTLAKRENVRLSFTARQFEASASRFRITNATRQVSYDQIEMLSVTMRSIQLLRDKEELSSKTVEALRRAVHFTYVPELYLDTKVSSYISVQNGNLRVLSYNNWSCGSYESKIDTDINARISVNAEMMTLLYKIADSSDVSFYVSGAHFIAANSVFCVALPPVRSTDADYGRFIALEQAMGSPTHKAILSKEFYPVIAATMGTIVLNKSLKGKAVPITLAVDTKKASVSFSADDCSTTEYLAAKNEAQKFSIKVDARILALVLKNVHTFGNDLRNEISAYGAIGKLKSMRLDYRDPSGSSLSYFIVANA